ncbi:MAG: BMP family ABC transporter substrate-binding protein [Solirubrobacterales bacterium]
MLLVALPLGILLFAGCGTSGTSTSGGGGGGGVKDIKSAWVWYGPIDDGGWNVANQAGQKAAEDALGNSLQVENSDNVPYTDAAGQVFEQYITTSGSNVLVDTVGLADIFTSVCNQHPDVYCIQTAPTTKLGKNTTGWFPKLWMIEYTAGVAAGLETKDNTVGYVLGYHIPLIIGAANAFTMGCKSVNAQCKVRIVVTNDYFNPPKTASAVSTLLDSNADVVRSYTDDQGYCQAVKDHPGALAIGEFWTNGDQCGDSALVSTVWDFEDYYTKEMKAIQSGDFVSSQLEWLDPKTSFSLRDWGPKVSKGVQDKIQQTLDDLASGKLNPFVGPIKDTSGAVRVPPGKKLSNNFLYSGWKWYVDGIVSG